jgi:hypothetical protein
MQTTGKTKGEQILESRGKTVSTSVREISPTGIKLEINSQDQITGKFKAQGVSTVTYWLKTDGTGEWESKGIGTTTEGDFIAGWGKGTGKATGPTTQSWEGEVHFMTQSPKLAWLNNAKVWVEGEGDQAKAEFVNRLFEQK